jgi:hypothetical protein
MADPDEWDEESDQLDAADTLDGAVPDPLDVGISPPERPWVGDGWGVTAREAAEGDGLDRYLARELPDVSVDDDGDGIGDTTDTDGEPWDDEVGEVRSGRLVDADGGGTVDGDADLWASDVGIDGAGASAEEAAVHVVGDAPPDDDGPSPPDLRRLGRGRGVSDR